MRKETKETKKTKEKRRKGRQRRRRRQRRKRRKRRQRLVFTIGPARRMRWEGGTNTSRMHDKILKLQKC